MVEIEMILNKGNETMMIPPPCSTCSSCGTCAGCDPEERNVESVARDFNAYYDSYGSCVVEFMTEDNMDVMVKKLHGIFRKSGQSMAVTKDNVISLLEKFGPIVSIDGRLSSTNTIPSAYSLKKLLVKMTNE